MFEIILDAATALVLIGVVLYVFYAAVKILPTAFLFIMAWLFEREKRRKIGFWQTVLIIWGSIMGLALVGYLLGVIK